MEEARKVHADAAAAVRSKPTNVSDIKNLLQFAGFAFPDEPTAGMGNILEGMQAHLNAFNELIKKQQEANAGDGSQSAPAQDAMMADATEQSANKRASGTVPEAAAPTPKRGKTNEQKKTNNGTPKHGAARGSDTPGGSCP